MSRWGRSGNISALRLVIARRVVREGCVMPIPFIRQTWIDLITLPPLSFGNRLGSLLSQVLFQGDRVPGVAFVYGVCEISDKRNQADQEVDDDIDEHHHSKTRREPTVNAFAALYNHHGQSGIGDIASTGRNKGVSA